MNKEIPQRNKDLEDITTEKPNLNEEMENFFNSPIQKIEREQIHEQVFAAMINERLINEFEESLYDVLDDDDRINKILDTINGFTNDEQKKILSIPASIRKRRFEVLLKNKKMNNADFVNELLQNAQDNGYTIGYHVSPYKINPDQNDWTVNPTGLDDRDNRAMAYYSLDYKNLFRKKRGEYLYVIRAETGTNSTHKRDTSNNWSRANKLAIITSLPLVELDEKVESVTK